MPNSGNQSKDNQRQAAGQTKFIFVTGGVVSSLGKGIASASIAMLLKARSYSVTIMKLDPYINVDPGTMNPLQHGEVFVTDDGAETDLDLGHYERFLDQSLSKKSNTTTGQVYNSVITKERKGQFLGKTVQVIPHITNEIKSRIKAHDGKYDVVIIEIGGTVGDIESLPFLETQRQMRHELGSQNSLNIHLTYVPYIAAAHELKTKPTQHSVKDLMEYGIQPDILLCRSSHTLLKDIREKIALFCNVDIDSVFEARDVDTIYEVPLNFAKKHITDIILDKLNLEKTEIKLDTWKKFVNKINNPKHSVRIALVGKYTKYQDSYKSIIEAFIHGGSINNTKIELDLINSEELENSSPEELLSQYNGVLIAPGFGYRGIEGKIDAIKFIRENKIPYFGICLGMQCAVIEYARNVCGIADASSGEFITKGDKVIDLMDTQVDVKEKGGTMRLGAYPCTLKKDSLAQKAYGDENISERHRHRYEFNNNYREIFEENEMIFSGLSPDEKLVEIIELKDHPWFVGVQFHPELKSRAVSGHPLFIDFVKATLTHKKTMNK
jgi:CTP synthase